MGHDSDERNFLFLDSLRHQVQLVEVRVMGVGAHIARVLLLLR